MTSLGGILISVAGVALAALDMNWTFLPQDLVLTIAAPIIFLSTAFMSLGIMLAKSWLAPPARASS